MKMSQVRTEWGVNGEREREHQISIGKDRALDINGNGMGQKCPLVKKHTSVFLVMQINRTNKLLIKMGGSQILWISWEPQHSFS
jgi:hypothetical protein